MSNKGLQRSKEQATHLKLVTIKGMIVEPKNKGILGSMSSKLRIIFGIRVHDIIAKTG
ncbi:hypothetical protein [Mucilaginibacter aquatilis]|uniref:Uncharacterized protein n=1 Tax=Mucilaginibacter aquatilis TaxID=1517760 RepID=A0A6I4IQE9_9SPHI|nr:hypothetical protein [Mucilaginibacter aquatilis]MVN91563.1 hypothetical protein [Mucilaginibacter aquatilis]